MKLQSELYLHELNALMQGLFMQMEHCVETLKKEKRRAQVAAFFAPWVSREIYSALAFKADVIMKHVELLSELREKILEAEGFDDDMRAITYKQICEKAEQINA
jgi:hypothetical protein